MFKKFDEKENLGAINTVRNSTQKDIRKELSEQFLHIGDYLDQIVPKKESLRFAKCDSFEQPVEVYFNPEGEPILFRARDGPILPTLRVVHRYPFILPWMRVDAGAVKYLLSGANVMCPGLTSRGGALADLQPNLPVLIVAEGKQHAVGVGITRMSSADILSKNKGIAIETMHYLGDGLWRLKSI